MAANRIKQTEIHVSPKVGDVVFYEYCDTVLPINQNPEYGSAHPNPVKYPNHKLSFIDAADDEGRVKWYYVADRTEQEDHNWRVSYPYAGLISCPRFTCLSVVPRSTFTPTARGTSHPLDLGDDTIAENARFRGANLVFEQQMEIGFKEIESLYIAVQRIYDKVPTIAEQLTHKIETSYPYAGIVACPRRTRTLVISRAEFEGTAKGTADPVFASSKLISEEQVETGDAIIENLYVVVRRTYDEVPTIAEQEAYNAEKEFPYQSDKRFPRTVRRYVVPRADLVTAANTPATAVLTLSGQPLDTQTVVIGNKTYTFQSVLTNVNGNVLIGADAAASLDNLKAAVNLSAGAGTLYAAATTAHTQVTATANTDTTQTFSATILAATDGNAAVQNALASTETLTNGAFGAATFTGAVDNYDAVAIPSAGLDLGGAILAYRKEDRFQGQAEDSLYVLVTVAHDRVPNLTTSGELDFLKGYGYRIERPFGTDDHHRVTWRIPAVGSGYTPSVDYAACPIVGHTGLLLVDESIEANPANAGTLDVVRVYDSLPGPELEKEVREKFADVPEGFLVSRITEQIRQPVRNNASIASLDGTLPTAVGGALVRTELGADGSSTTVITKGSTRLTYTLGTMKDVEYDDETGKVFDVTHEIVPASSAAGANLDTGTGIFSIVRKLNQYFSIKTSRKATTLGTGDDVRTYDDVVNWGWPAVLPSGQPRFYAVEAKEGHLIRFGYDIDLKEAYSGPCRATIVESWSPTAQAVPTVVHMMPTPIFFDFPMTRNFMIPACLHPAITLEEIVGSTHPTLHSATTTKTFAATNYTDWPNTIIGAVSQTPYRGGFRMKVMTVYKPA
jgi:hypothetical protein